MGLEKTMHCDTSDPVAAVGAPLGGAAPTVAPGSANLPGSPSRTNRHPGHGNNKTPGSAPTPRGQV
jgi:hypothetical protein